MRFFNLAGILQKGRRFVSRPSSVSSEEVKDPVKLGELIRTLSLRVSELEAKSAPDWVEFEKNITGTPGVPVSYSFAHNLGSPVRFYVTYWSGTDKVAAGIIAQSTSTADRLDVKAYSTGRIVLRIEPSQNGVT